VGGLAALRWVIIIIDFVIIILSGKVPPVFLRGGIASDFSPSAIPRLAVQMPLEFVLMDAHSGKTVQPILCGGGIPSGRRYPEFWPVPFGNQIAMEKQFGPIRLGISALGDFASHKCPADFLCYLAHMLFFWVAPKGHPLNLRL